MSNQYLSKLRKSHGHGANFTLKQDRYHRGLYTEYKQQTFNGENGQQNLSRRPRIFATEIISLSR